MSFGFSVGDVVLFAQLALKTVQNARKACGEHDELTREVSSLHIVIERLEKEASKPESPINRPDDNCKKELRDIVDGCKKALELLNRVLEKYNALSERERSAKRLWQRVRFGNGELADLRDLREKLTYYTSALSLFVNMVTMGSIGRVEQQMETAGGDIRAIRIAVNGITAHFLSASHREGSVLTTYADDDKAVWKEFRKELIEEGFSSSIIRKHKLLIKAYIKELGDRGLLDDENPHDVEGLSELAGSDTNDLTEDCVPGVDGLDISSYKALFDRAGIRVLILPVYEGAKKFHNDNDHSFVPSGDCLTVGERQNTGLYTGLWLLFERFKARLQILIECLPHGWIFRAREDIADMHIYVANSVYFELDCHVVQYFADSALEILSVLNCISLTSTAREFLAGLEFIIVEGYHLQKVSWASLEELVASEWPHQFDIIFEELRQEFGTESGMLFEDIYGIGNWIRRFDTECCASAQRMTVAWLKAADLVINSSYNGMTSLALIFTDDQVCPEHRKQCQDDIDCLRLTYSRVFNNYGVVYNSNSVSARMHRVVEDPDGKSGPSRTDQDGPYYCTNVDTNYRGPIEGADALAANEDALHGIWQDVYILRVLPNCQRFISKPPSDTKSRDLAYKTLTWRILSQVIIRLDAVPLKGHQALSRDREDMLTEAQDMLSRLYEEVDGARAKNPRGRSANTNSAKATRKWPAASASRLHRRSSSTECISPWWGIKPYSTTTESKDACQTQ